MVTFLIKLRTYRGFCSQADPARENEFEVAHILLETNVSRQFKTK